MIDVDFCAVKELAHVHRHGYTLDDRPLSFLRRRWSACGDVRVSSCVDELMRASVLSQFPLRSSLLCTICPRVAFHPHHLGADGTFLPPPSPAFIFSAPFSPSMSICHTSRRRASSSLVRSPFAMRKRCHLLCHFRRPVSHVPPPLQQLSWRMPASSERLSLLQCESRKG